MTLNRLRDVADWARSFPRLNELTPDFSYASILKSSSIGNLGSRSRLQVILGTHSILADGGLQSIAGSHMIAVSASHHSGQSIEWIVFAEVEIMFIHSVLSSHAVINGNRLMNPSKLAMESESYSWMDDQSRINHFFVSLSFLSASDRCICDVQTLSSVLPICRSRHVQSVLLPRKSLPSSKQLSGWVSAYYDIIDSWTT